MEINNAPNPAPPPMAQPSESDDPYKFIFDPNKEPAKKLLPSTNTKRGRILIIAVGLIVLLIIISLVSSLITNAGQAGTKDLIELAQRQQEIVRVAQIGVTKSKGQDARNLATNTQLTVASDQQQLLVKLKKSKKKISSKELGLRLNNRTDVLLRQADQNNQFDETFTKTITSQLTTYQKAITKSYGTNTDKTIRGLLKTEYNNATTLIGSDSPPSTI